MYIGFYSHLINWFLMLSVPTIKGFYLKPWATLQWRGCLMSLDNPHVVWLGLSKWQFRKQDYDPLKKPAVLSTSHITPIWVEVDLEITLYIIKPCSLIYPEQFLLRMTVCSCPYPFLFLFIYFFAWLLHHFSSHSVTHINLKSVSLLFLIYCIQRFLFCIFFNGHSLCV